MPGIVVGVNGSPHSERALEWAMKHAAALQVPLTALAVHEVPKSYWGGIPVVGPADEVVLAQLRQAAEEMTQRVADRLGDARPPKVTVRAVSGFVVRELVSDSQNADLTRARRAQRRRLRPARVGLGEPRGGRALRMPGGDRPARRHLTGDSDHAVTAGRSGLRKARHGVGLGLGPAVRADMVKKSRDHQDSKYRDGVPNMPGSRSRPFAGVARPCAPGGA